MKKINFYFLFFLGFVLLSFQFSQKKEINDSEKEQKLRELISKTQLLELPIFLDVYQEEKTAKLIGLNKLLAMNVESMDEGNGSRPVVGILPDTTNYITFLTYGVGDILYPMFTTFDKEGNLIENKVLCLYDHMFVFEEINTSYETNTVNISKADRGLEITLLSIAKGKRYREFEENIENTNLTDSLFCQKIIQIGHLNENGKVIFDVKIVEDCR